MAEPKVNAGAISAGYWTDLINRRDDAVQRIKKRQELAVTGKAIPDDDQLVIGEGRYLPAAVMFIDISGFSGWPSGNRTEQSDVLTVLNLFMSEMIRILSDYGGEVEKNTGDGLLAYFDVQTGENEAETCKRAISCGLTMRLCTKDLINPVLSEPLPQVKFRIGLDFGGITVAKIGSPKIFNSRAAIGSTANIAAKMLAHGGPDDFVIGNDVRKRLPPGWIEHAQFLTPASGFVYVATGEAYCLYRYTGVWNKPA
jgi:adenylate cyclase